MAVATSSTAGWLLSRLGYPGSGAWRGRVEQVSTRLKKQDSDAANCLSGRFNLKGIPNEKQHFQHQEKFTLGIGGIQWEERMTRFQPGNYAYPGYVPQAGWAFTRDAPDLEARLFPKKVHASRAVRTPDLTLTKRAL
eukprot:2533003-Rhodomonas_salina.1